MNHWTTSLVIMMTITSTAAYSASNTPTQPNNGPTSTATGNNNNGNMNNGQGNNGGPTSTATGNNGGNNNNGNMNNGQGNNSGPTSTATGNNGGNNNNGNNNNQPLPKVTAAQCTTISTKLQPQGNACLKISDFNARSACFNAAPGKAGVDNNQLNACMQSNSPPLTALKSSLQAQEKKLYPSQQSALNGGSNGGGNGGGNNQPPLPTMTAAQCAAIATKLAPQGNACLKVSDFNSRVTCFNNAPGKANVDPNQMNACGNMGALDSLKNSLMAQEKKLYPNQASALNANNNNGGNNGGANNGPNSGGNNNQQVAPFPASQCTSLMPQLTTFANNCLKQKDFQARSSCFQGADSQFPAGFFNGGCSAQIQPVKDSVQAQEKKLYPDQPSALH